MGRHMHAIVVGVDVGTTDAAEFFYRRVCERLVAIRNEAWAGGDPAHDDVTFGEP